jgi:hypothetical protein
VAIDFPVSHWTLDSQEYPALLALKAGLGWCARPRPADYPTAAATAFLPIAVGGTGAREIVLVLRGGKLLDMSSNDAVAASLLLWISIPLIGAIGGALLLLGRGKASLAPAPAAAGE